MGNMKETIFHGHEIIGCIEDMNEQVFKDFNSIRIWVDGVEVLNLYSLAVIVYKEE